jgi:putative cardiolipin synthase
VRNDAGSARRAVELPAARRRHRTRHAVAALALAPDETAYGLFRSGEDEFAARLTSIALAGRSARCPVLLWHDDLTGRAIGRELLRAADRGVRVRVILDDVTARGHDDELAVLDSHERIEIRVFNPFRTRGSTIGNGLEFIFGGGRVNYRMHNKLWIADSRLAIVGGRNIGDEYFGAHEEVNFGDLGVLMAGHVVADADAEFDLFWNSDSVVPISAFAQPRCRRCAGRKSARWMPRGRKRWRRLTPSTC